jgi:hypothetical protein
MSVVGAVIRDAPDTDGLGCRDEREARNPGRRGMMQGCQPTNAVHDGGSCSVLVHGRRSDILGMEVR